jgi:uncharacterized protein YgiM (DUF1202 family)
LSRHNYSQYSNKNNNAPIEEEVCEESVVIENDVPEISLVEETVETVVIPEIVVGCVANCAKLNVRAKPNTNADVICVLEAASEVNINVADSNTEWFKVCTATGIEGYCMRKFVNASL